MSRGSLRPWNQDTSAPDSMGRRRNTRKKTRRTINPRHIFDIETEDWTGFVMGCWWDREEDKVRRFWWTEEEQMADALLAQQGEAWAHNGGRFDNRWVIRHAIRRSEPAQLSVAGSRIITAAVGGMRFCDSKALFPLSLKDFTADSAVSKDECPVPWSDIKRGMDREKALAVMDYCERDVRSLGTALDDFCRFAEEHDLDLGATIGGSAYRDAARKLGIPDADFTMAEHMKLRCAYYGGRTEVYQLNVPAVREYDINSAYPDALVRTPLPVGQRRWLRSPAAARDAFRRKEPGIYAVEVTVPKCHIPPLPARGREGLIYPTGTWRGWYTLPELLYAQERGARVRPLTACVWEAAESVLAEWCRQGWELRARASLRPGSAVGKKSAVGTWLKWRSNSVTGKLGQRPQRTRIHCWPETGPLPDWEEISDDPQIFASTQEALDACGHVHWAAYLTAATRVKLHTQQMAGPLGGTDMVYSDTDSVLCELEREGVGSELGEWEAGGPFYDFEALAPKVYRYRSTGPGETKCVTGKVRAKGIPLPDSEPKKRTDEEKARQYAAHAATFDKLKAGEAVSWTGVAGLRDSLRRSEGRDPFTRGNFSRQLQPVDGWIGGRLLNDDGRTTRPPAVSASFETVAPGDEAEDIEDLMSTGESD